MKNPVLYEELLPGEFTRRIQAAPIAYLPLGTLEWHGEHMPLGADGIQSQALFERLAREVGGVVLPKLFLGPDFVKEGAQGQLIGMDHFVEEGKERSYPEQQLPGSAYYVPDALYHAMVDAIAGQLARAGIRILVAHGHGPSTRQFQALAPEMEKQHGLRCLCCFFDDYGENWREEGFQVDHGASNETSIVMACREDLVDMAQITAPAGVMPLGLAGVDPRGTAGAQVGEKIFAYTQRRMAALLRQALAELRA